MPIDDDGVTTLLDGFSLGVLGDFGVEGTEMLLGIAEEFCDDELIRRLFEDFAGVFFCGFFLGLAAGRMESTRGFFGVSLGERKLSRLV